MFGFLLIDKPAGITSRQVVVTVGQRLQQLGYNAPVGHCGTLDPLATGLMVLAIGPATHLTPWLQSGNKRYRATFQLGVHSESLDLETPLVPAIPDTIPNLEIVRDTCARFVGRNSQVPPKYSAVRVQGKRAYELARVGQEFQLAPREIVILNLNLLRFDLTILEIDVLCSGGTYIRTLGDDLAQAWGTRAVMTSLQRTGASCFNLDDAWSWDAITFETSWSEQLVDVVTALSDLPHVTVDLGLAKRFRNGLVSHELDAKLNAVWLDIENKSRETPGRKFSKDTLILLPDQRPVGIAYYRSKPGQEDAWRIKLNLARWLEPDLV